MLAIGQFLDGLVPEKCIPDPDYCIEEMRPGKFFHKTSAKGIKGIAISSAKVGSAHLWRDRPLYGNLICFSDTLVDEIKAADLKLPKHYRMIEVS